MSEEKKNLYMEILSEELAENYNMLPQKALEVVKNSFVSKMLIDDDDAIWQMHQPLESTIDEIFCEYKGLPVEI